MGSRTLFISLASLCLVLGQAHAQQTVVDLRDFRTKEVQSVGLTLNRDVKVQINALGGGDDRSSWFNFFDNGDDEGETMFATGWIINATTREPVWEMTMRNSRGRDYRRSSEDEITLKQGSYEVYFAATGFARRHGKSHYSINIDRRSDKDRRSQRGYTVSFSGDDDAHEEFMENAKDYGLTLSVQSSSDASAIRRFDAPMQFKNQIFAAQQVGDDAWIRKSLTVAREVPVRIYAIGEGRRRDGMYDYGWIVRSDTRERVWEMRTSNTERAGGSTKNRKFDREIKLAPGSYELVFITDDSHSNEDWNATPPLDVYNHGIALLASNESDQSAVTVKDVEPMKSAFVTLTHPGDNDYKTAGFTLKNDSKVRVYAFGESANDGDAADYGWIVDAKTRERVWDMSRSRTEHGGGAQKNRYVDEIVSLPRGSYIAYYVTDGSHSFDEWNADPPFDPEHYGLTIMGAGERFNASDVSMFDEGKETDVLAQLTRVSDHKRLSKRFTLDRQTHVRVYALGEGQDRHMYDYGWIENTENGNTVWEMTYNMTSRAGGAKKNRLVNSTIVLDKGEYELHYETDDSHSFNDWNDDPPEDRTHWGITVYRKE